MERSPHPTATPPAAEETLHEQVQVQHCAEPLSKEDVSARAQDMLRQQAEAHANQPDQLPGQ